MSVLGPLWRDEPIVYDQQDTIKQFLITEDGKKIIFLGTSYHYIFDNKSGVIKELLEWKSKSKLTIRGEDALEIDASNNVSGTITVNAVIDDYSQKQRQLQDDEVKFLKKLGFKIRKDKVSYETYYLEKEIILKGVRYLPKPDVNYQIGSDLSREYKIKIGHKHGFMQSKTAKVALTPLAITAEGGLVILGLAAAPLIILVWIGAGIGEGKANNKNKNVVNK